MPETANTAARGALLYDQWWWETGAPRHRRRTRVSRRAGHADRRRGLALRRAG